MYSKIYITPPHKKIPVNALYKTIQLKVLRSFIGPEIPFKKAFGLKKLRPSRVSLLTQGYHRKGHPFHLSYNSFILQ